MRQLVERLICGGRDILIVSETKEAWDHYQVDDGSEVALFPNEEEAYEYANTYRTAQDLRSLQPGQQYSMQMADGQDKKVNIVNQTPQSVTMTDPQSGETFVIPHVQPGSVPQAVQSPQQQQNQQKQQQGNTPGVQMINPGRTYNRLTAGEYLPSPAPRKITRSDGAELYRSQEFPYAEKGKHVDVKATSPYMTPNKDHVTAMKITAGDIINKISVGPIKIYSFGQKFGITPPCDTVISCKGAKNPHDDPQLRPLNGLHPAVQEFVIPQSEGVLAQAEQAVSQGAPCVAFFCFGGRHRSVAIAEEFSRRLRAKGIQTVVEHLTLAQAEAQDIPKSAANTVGQFYFCRRCNTARTALMDRQGHEVHRALPNGQVVRYLSCKHATPIENEPVKPTWNPKLFPKRLSTRNIIAQPAPMPGQQAMPSAEDKNQQLPMSSEDELPGVDKPKPQSAPGSTGRILNRHEIIEECETLIRNSLWEGVRIGTMDLVKYLQQQYGNPPEELYEGADFSWKKVIYEEPELFNRGVGPGNTQQPPGRPRPGKPSQPKTLEEPEIEENPEGPTTIKL